MPLLRRVLLIAALVLVLGFLVLPVVVVVPLSFSTARYLSSVSYTHLRAHET